MFDLPYIWHQPMVMGVIRPLGEGGGGEEGLSEECGESGRVGGGEAQRPTTTQSGQMVEGAGRGPGEDAP